jgi:predicted O-methyltransferase YrrM
MENFKGITYKLSNSWLNYIPKYEKPINYLEIGTFHGANLFSVLKNYCNHDDSRLYTVDPWQDYDGYDEYKNNQDKNYNIFMNNYEKCNEKHKITVCRGFSNEEIPKFADEFFDMIYIDGNHEPEYVLEDAVLSFRKLKKGGWMIFDDYGWVDTSITDLKEREDRNTKHGIDAFLNAYRNRIYIENAQMFNHQVFVQKKF